MNLIINLLKFQLLFLFLLSILLIVPQHHHCCPTPLIEDFVNHQFFQLFKHNQLYLEWILKHLNHLHSHQLLILNYHLSLLLNYHFLILHQKLFHSHPQIHQQLHQHHHHYRLQHHLLLLQNPLNQHLKQLFINHLYLFQVKLYLLILHSYLLIKHAIQLKI